MREKWKWVVGYEGYYLVSNAGRVMSVPHKPKVGPNCGYLLKQRRCNSGYPAVVLSVDGKKKNAMVHRMVAQAFVENPKGKEEVNHIDGDKTNNSVENLEWVTRSENAVHAYKNLPRKKSNYHHSVKLTADKARSIRSEPGTAASIAKKYGISDVMVLKIKKRECWKEV